MSNTDIVTVVRCGNCKEGGCGDRSSSGKKVRCGGRSLGGGDGGGRELTSWMMIWGLIEIEVWPRNEREDVKFGYSPPRNTARDETRDNMLLVESLKYKILVLLFTFWVSLFSKFFYGLQFEKAMVRKVSLPLTDLATVESIP